MKRIKC